MIAQIVDIASGVNGALVALDSTGGLFSLVPDEQYHLPQTMRGLVWREMVPRPPGKVDRLTFAHDQLTVLVDGHIYQRVRDQREMQFSKWVWQELAPPQRQGPVMATSEFEAA